MPFFERPFVIPSFVLGVALVIAALIGSMTLTSLRSFDNTLTSTGSAKERVMSDNVKWTSHVTRSVYESGVAGAYTQVERDMDAAKAFFMRAGISESEMRISPTFTDQDYSYYRDDANAPRRFIVRKDITIESGDVAKVQALAQDISSLIRTGVSISIDAPQYYVTKLPELRVSLLGKALEDARARVTEIAGSAETSVGSLKSASSGVVQVLAPNSIEVTDYGSYDTMTPKKDVMVTVRATFFVR